MTGVCSRFRRLRRECNSATSGTSLACPFITGAAVTAGSPPRHFQCARPSARTPLRAGGHVLRLTCELASGAERQAMPHADGNSAAGPANGPLCQLTSLVTNRRAARAGRNCRGRARRCRSEVPLTDSDSRRIGANRRQSEITPITASVETIGACVRPTTRADFV